MKIGEILPEAKENVSLAKYTTFKIGGPARYFFIAKNKEDLIKAIKTAKDSKTPFIILGDGSNVLVNDEGFSGLVIKIQNTGLEYKNSEIQVGAGVKLNDLVSLATNRSLSGLEWAAGIPGTIGGAVYGNALAFGINIAGIVKGVEVLDTKTMEVKMFNKRQCCFSSKDSIFKRNKNLIITSVVLKLKKGRKSTMQKEIKEHLAYRKKRHPLHSPSAGSVFINNEMQIKNPKLLKEFPKLNDFNKWSQIPSAYLIEKCGLKGKRIGQAEFSTKHANFIINLKKAKAKDVLRLIKLAEKEVKKKFNINLKREIQIIK